MSLFKKRIFSSADEKRIVSAIETAEKNTSGEIRVHVESSFVDDPVNKAREVFVKLHMHETAERNGILFYVNIKQHAFAIWGDEGINRYLPEGFWDEISKTVISYLKEGKYGEGLEKGILCCGENLKKYFPILPDDKNELSNDITYS
jgi:uncharacterized membrane protein